MDNEREKLLKKLKIVLRIVFSLAFVIIALLLIRYCLFSEGKWVTCRITTPEGEIHIRVYPNKAPVTAANFLRYVGAGLYNGTAFFRVLTPNNQPDNPFKIEVIQGGDVDEKKCFPPIALETTKMTGLRHQDGAISMARAEPGTATSSFFICIGTQPELDYGGRRNPDGQGFAAFGRVVKGMDIVRRIQKMDQDKQYLQHPVVITSLIRMMKPYELRGHINNIGDIWEALRFTIRRMTFKDFATLFALLALVGWLAWRGYFLTRFARMESPAWEGSSWASGRRNLENTPLWLRVLLLILFLLWLGLFIIFMGS